VAQPRFESVALHALSAIVLAGSHSCGWDKLVRRQEYYYLGRVQPTISIVLDPVQARWDVHAPKNNPSKIRRITFDCCSIGLGVLELLLRLDAIQFWEWRMEFSPGARDTNPWQRSR
jgi:hypothetical protein